MKVSDIFMMMIRHLFLFSRQSNSKKRGGGGGGGEEGEVEGKYFWLCSSKWFVFEDIII